MVRRHRPCRAGDAVTYCIKGSDGVHRNVADHIRYAVEDEVLFAGFSPDETDESHVSEIRHDTNEEVNLG